jgi:hypothetical protein
MPEAPRWARVRGDVNCRVRRGAWYQVAQLTTDVVVLRAGDRSVSVPRELMQIALVRPRSWSVVRRPYDAVDVPRQWGSRYGVCPGCQHRMPLDHDQAEAHCERCGASGAIAWREGA